jgi:hypothetical protein
MKNQLIRIKVVTLVVLFAFFVMLGCGGSGGGGGSSTFQLFVTDDLHPGYSGVWVKIFKANLKDASGASVQVFNSTDGLTVNLRDLHDGAARFLLLAPGQVPDGTYNKVVFELDKSVTLVAKPSGAVSTANFPNSLDSTVVGHSDLSVDLSPTLIVPGAPRLVIDFDLKNWIVAGGVITPVLNHHNGNGLDDPDRHHRFEFKGFISNLAGVAPNQTFSLALRNGGTVSVSTDDTTQIIGDANVNTLSNGLRVEVYGAFNPLTGKIAAKIVRAESDFDDDQKAIGFISNPSFANLNFELAPSFTRGFVPQGEKIIVQTNGSTRYRGRHGSTLTATQFYDALVASGPNVLVEAEGIYNSGSNTMTAKSVHFESESDMGEDEGKGTTSSPNSEAGTFSVSLTEFEGFSPPGGLLPVIVSPNAEFRGSNGNSITKSAFFEIITSGSKTVDFKGAYANNIFTASRVRLRN